MWWMDENGALPESSSREGAAVRYRLGLENSVAPKRKKRLRLPITEAQAAANLLLQESGASGEGEAKVLRDDIRALESKVKEQRDELNEVETQFAAFKESAEDSAALTEELAEGLENDLHQSMRDLKCREGWARDAVAECARLIQLLMNARATLAERELEFDAWQTEASEEDCERKRQLDESLSNAETYKRKISELEMALEDQVETHRLELETLANSPAPKVDEHTLDALHAANRRLLSQTAELVTLKKQLQIAKSEGSEVSKSSLAALEHQHEQETSELRAKLDEVVRELDCAMSELHESRRMIQQMRGDHARCAARLFEQIEQAEEQSSHSASECTRQRNRAEELLAEVQQLNDKDRSNTRTIGELQDSIDSLRAELQQTQVERGSSSECTKELREQLDELTRLHAELQETHQRSHAERTELLATNGILIRDNDRLTQSLQSLNEHNERLSLARDSESKEASRKIEELTETLRRQQEDFDEATRRAEESSAKIRSERDQLEIDFQNLRRSAGESRQEHERQIAQLKTTLETQEAELIHAMSESEQLQTKLDSVVASLEQQREAHDSAIARRDTELTAAQNEIAKLMDAVQAEGKHRRVAELESKRLSLTRSQRIGFLARQRESLLRELADLRDERGDSEEAKRAA